MRFYLVYLACHCFHLIFCEFFCDEKLRRRKTFEKCTYNIASVDERHTTREVDVEKKYIFICVNGMNVVLTRMFTFFRFCVFPSQKRRQHKFSRLVCTHEIPRDSML